MIAYRATLDVPRELVQLTAKLLAAERRRRGTPAGSRALTCFWEAVLALRWFGDRTSPGALARDHGVSRATAYRYLDEVIEVLAAQAPDLHHARKRAKDEGLPHVILDGKMATGYAFATINAGALAMARFSAFLAERHPGIADEARPVLEDYLSWLLAQGYSAGARALSLSMLRVFTEAYPRTITDMATASVGTCS